MSMEKYHKKYLKEIINQARGHYVDSAERFDEISKMLREEHGLDFRNDDIREHFIYLCRKLDHALNVIEDIPENAE